MKMNDILDIIDFRVVINENLRDYDRFDAHDFIRAYYERFQHKYEALEETINGGRAIIDSHIAQFLSKNSNALHIERVFDAQGNATRSQSLNLNGNITQNSEWRKTQ